MGLPAGSALLPGGSLTIEGRPSELERATLSNLFESVPAVIFVKNAETLRFEFFNHAAEHFLGISREAVIGKSDADFFPADQVAFFAEKDRGVLQERKALDIPREPIDTVQGRGWLHTRKIPILDKRGSPRYLLGVSLDATTRRVGRSALPRLHADLEQRVAALRFNTSCASRERSRDLPAGDVNVLYNRYGRAILGHCRRFLGSTEAAEDATQEVFMRALRQTGRWPAAPELRPWLFRIATNYCLNELRRRRVRAHDSLEEAPAPDGSLEDCLVARSEMARLLARLPKHVREVLRLTHVEGMLQQEVAEALGVSRRTVVNYLTQLRSHL